MSSRLAYIVLLATLVGLFAWSASAALTPDQHRLYAGQLADNARGSFPPISTSGDQAPVDAAASALVWWDRLRRDTYPATFAELSSFLRHHPGWPLETQLRRRAERLIEASTPLPDRMAYFAQFPPLSASAKFRASEAYLPIGRGAEAVRLARQAWVSDGLPLAQEAELGSKFFGSLTPDDHFARADRLLWSGQSSAVIRMGALIPAPRRAVIDTRLALKSDAVGAAEQLAALSAADRLDPGLIVDQVAWLRRAQQVFQARVLLADAVIAQGAPLDPVRWMQLRREMARSAVLDGQYELAYRIAANHRTFPLGRGLSAGSDAERDVLTDLEFLAGWTALRNLGEPVRAMNHFQNYRNAAKSPLTQARGDYWAGRAADVAGDTPRARRFYESAATHPDFFFGQLSAERLGRPLSLPQEPRIAISSSARQRFDENEIVRAAQLLGEIGDRARQTMLLKHLAETAETPVQQHLVASLAITVDRPDIGVLVSREARSSGGAALLDAAYPRLPFGPLAGDISLVHGVTRQESRFDQTAVSPANARGLMQLMPATAREQAGKLGLPYDQARLTGDQQYNATLGAAYLQRLVDRWDGNTVLAVASYNAGAGNVSKWVRANGDPRDPNVDVIDWIEKIPFSETRIYVWRVLENSVMYDLLHRPSSMPPVPNRLSTYLAKRRPE